MRTLNNYVDDDDNDDNDDVDDDNGNNVDVLHVRVTDLHAAHQNLPFPPNRTSL